jgi:predicted metal-dependent enzyme (double-stranded beta helix superfamily)
VTVELESEEFYVDTAAFKQYVADVTDVLARHEAPAEAIAALREPFSRLLWSDDWLPGEFALPALNSGMGGGIGSYLLYRNAERTLSISSLVVPAGAMTPVHDHLAWGLVGLYRGEQHEEVFRRTDGGDREGRADLELVERRHLGRGDFYELIPPEGDIHRVVAADEQPSVSIHLLRNDVGCIHRHAFEPEEHVVKGFRSGYVNVECADEEAAR